LDSDWISKRLAAISECDEFKKAALFVIDQPSVGGYGTVHSVSTVYINDGRRFKDSCWLYSIGLIITYDPLNFVPAYRLSLRGVFDRTDLIIKESTEELSVYETWTDKWSFKL
jgi:hypothetical protein